MNYTAIAQNMSNITSLSDVLKLANTATNDAFWTGIFWMILVIILISTLAFGFETAMILSFFASVIFGMFLLYLGLINMWVLGMTIAGLFFLMIYFIYTSNKSQ